MADEPGLAAELRAAAGFLRAGGELAVIGPAGRLPGALAEGEGRRRRRPADPPHVARPRSEAPALAVGWC